MTRHQHGGLKKRCACARRQWTKCAHPWHLHFKHHLKNHRVSLDVIARAVGEPKPRSKAEARISRIGYGLRSEPGETPLCDQ